jgi:hypothetical protein
LYSSPNIIRVIESSSIRCEGHLGRLREIRKAYEILVAKTERERPLGDPGVDVGIILK